MIKSTKHLRYLLSRFLKNQSGSSTILLAFGLVAFCGMGALAVDMGYFYVLQNQLQITADAAALAALSQLPDEDAARASAQEYATMNMGSSYHGTVLESSDVVMGNWDSSSRMFTAAGNPVNSVQVTTRKSQANGNAAPTFFSRIFGADEVDITTSAIAAIAGNQACLLALDPTVGDAIGLNGDSRVRLEQCGAQSNSNSAASAALRDGARMETESISAVGNIVDNGDLDSNTTPVTGAPAAKDPFKNLGMPAFSGCGGGNNLTVTSDTTLSPGVYCGGLTITNNSDVHLNPGTYIIDGGDLTIEGISDLIGDGVTIFLTSSTGASDIGSLMIVDHSRVEITAPTTGTYANISIFQDPDAPTTGRNDISGTSSGSGPGPELEVDGILYFPSQEVYLDGDARIDADPDGCLIIVVRQLTMTDDSRLEIDCQDGSVSSVPVGQSNRLVN